ncbi:unnamed protein product [Phytophthora fragariaefolia]|uniref:Unnamed protein product n=1 Tax=Phytophthora fragariaefolia TaxID=1490495 RepID=A0A9W6UB32_9STRA|nr:unnamed protein product [Phytophthora fragariaefolia]
MAKGSSAVPATLMKWGRIEMEGGPTHQTGSGGRLSSISKRSVSFDESAGGISEAKDEEVNDFGTSDIGLKTPPTVRPKGDADPSQIPLPQTPKKNEHGKESDDGGVFGVKTEGTLYFRDSHVVTPQSSNRDDRLALDTEASNSQRGDARALSGRSHRRFVSLDDYSDDDSGEDYYYRKEDAGYDDPSDELARQVRVVSEMERLNSTPRVELATHRPLAQIKAFSGLRNKSENSMQWLRTFVYEMKGTRTPPNEWCMVFELSLRD